MRGYTGREDLFHRVPDCTNMRGGGKSLPETKALKWGIDHCPECFPELFASDAATNS